MGSECMNSRSVKIARPGRTALITTKSQLEEQRIGQVVVTLRCRRMHMAVGTKGRCAQPTLERFGTAQPMKVEAIS